VAARGGSSPEDDATGRAKPATLILWGQNDIFFTPEVDDDLDEDLIRGTLSGWSSGELEDDLALGVVPGVCETRVIGPP
jgi:hypothetical protein